MGKYKKPKDYEKYFLGSLLNKGINAIAPESKFANVAGSVLGTALDAFTGNPIGAVQNGLDGAGDIASLFMAEGGYRGTAASRVLVNANGGELTKFEEGGSHEMNPNGGIPLGQNLVEQGETMHDDFIFSDRLTITKELADEFSIPKKLIGKSFASASEYYDDPKRPDDKISQRGKEKELANLKQAQESYKQVEGIETGIKMQDGGKQKQPWPNPLAYTFPRTDYDYPATGPYLESGQNPLFNPIDFNIPGADMFRIPRGGSAEGNPTTENVGQPGLQKYSQQPDSGTRATSTPSVTGGGTPRPEEKLINLPAKPNPLNNSLKLELKTAGIPSREEIAKKSQTNTSSNTDERGLSLTDLRYAPIAGDLFNTAMLAFDKPDQLDLNKFNTNIDFQPNLVDREQIRRDINSQAGATAQSLKNVTGGNSGNLLANLQGLSRSSNNAIANANLQSDVADQAELARVQNANFQQDATNNRNRMAVQNINDANQGQYRTMLMDSITNTFQNLGAIGQDEVNRKMMEEMPLEYMLDRRFNNTFKNNG